MEKEKVDKAALGYDYKGQTEKHQSQKGESAAAASVTFECSVLDSFSSPAQITRRVLEGSSVWRGRKWTKLPWATIIRARRRNISLRKVWWHSVCVHTSYNPTLTGCVCSDYSSGFGGRYGVQTDRMDKVSFTAI